ncbi:MAG: type II secretion system F family protein [Candidatus Aminicenantia bacterium]
MRFSYIAKTKTGESRSGIIDALNILEARKILLGKDLIVISVTPLREKAKREFLIPFLEGVSFLDKLLFAKHLSLMIKVVVSIRESIATIQEQSKSKKFKKILDDVLKGVDDGQPLADTLARYPEIFDLFYINMIKIGEESGSLEKSLEHLAIQLEKNHELKMKIRAAMIYPSIILTSIAVLSISLTFFILPKITPIFEAFDVELPLSTRILIGTTEFLKDYGLFALVGTIFLFLFFSLLYRLRPIRLLVHKIVLKLPLFGSMTKSINLAYLSRNLGILLKSGVPLVSALNTTQATLENLIYQKEIERAAEEVKKGRSVSSHFQKREPLFPPMISRMVGVGEKTGNLEETLIYLSNFYEVEVDKLTKNLSAIIEPILLLITGMVVGFVALSIISPIYEITRGLHF